MEEEKGLTQEEIDEMLEAYEEEGYDVFKLKEKQPGLDNDIKKELKK